LRWSRTWRASSTAWRSHPGAPPEVEEAAAQPLPESPELRDETLKSFPADCRRTVELGIERCRDYQDIAYGDLYVQRMTGIVALEADRAEAGRIR
jgi:hypothetical protein